MPEFSLTNRFTPYIHLMKTSAKIGRILFHVIIYVIFPLAVIRV